MVIVYQCMIMLHFPNTYLNVITKYYHYQFMITSNYLHPNIEHHSHKEMALELLIEQI